jgi:hypothetical protein
LSSPFPQRTSWLAWLLRHYESHAARVKNSLREYAGKIWSLMMREERHRRWWELLNDQEKAFQKTQLAYVGLTIYGQPAQHPSPVEAALMFRESVNQLPSAGFQLSQPGASTTAPDMAAGANKRPPPDDNETMVDPSKKHWTAAVASGATVPQRESYDVAQGESEALP